MADYTVLSSVSRSIIELLSKNMIPEVLHSTDSIDLNSPEEKGDMQLYVYLYHIAECREIAQDYQRYSIQPNLHMQDSKFLYLYYQFTASAASEIKFRALEEQNILGKIIQIFNDNHSLSVKDFSGKNKPPIEGVPINMMLMNQEEISRIWSGLQLRHRLALYYRVGPVELESELIEKSQRITEVKFEMEEK